LEATLLELYFFCETTSLNIGEEEGLHEIFDEGFVVVVAAFEGFEVFVHFLFAEVGHDAGLAVGCSFDGVVDDPVEVAVDCALVHLDDLFVQALFSCSNDLFCVSATSLFDFSISSLVLSLFHFGLDLLLFGGSH
jgi:hypothetical protein